MPKLCAWCGSKDIIGNFPVVLDKSRVVRMRFDYLKYEDKIFNFLFPICQTCKRQIRKRKDLDNTAIKIIVAFALVVSIVFGIINRNIGMAIAASFVMAALLFVIYSIIKNLLLKFMKYASETSWGTFDGSNFVFNKNDFANRFINLNNKTRK